MSYLEYINKLSELKQTIVGFGDALSALGNLFVLLGKFALTTIVVAALATIIAVVVDWFIEKLMNGISGLLKESIGINSDVLFMFTAMVGILGSFIILTSIGVIGAIKWLISYTTLYAFFVGTSLMMRYYLTGLFNNEEEPMW